MEPRILSSASPIKAHLRARKKVKPSAFLCRENWPESVPRSPLRGFVHRPTHSRSPPRGATDNSPATLVRKSPAAEPVLVAGPEYGSAQYKAPRHKRPGAKRSTERRPPRIETSPEPHFDRPTGKIHSISPPPQTPTTASTPPSPAPCPETLHRAPSAPPSPPPHR